MTIDISDADHAIVQRLLTLWLPTGVEAYVFGSRADGSARRYSDLDLALRGPAPLDVTLLGDLAEALSDSDLTIKVDLIDLLAVNARFRALIEPRMIKLPLDGPGTAATVGADDTSTRPAGDA